MRSLLLRGCRPFLHLFQLVNFPFEPVEGGENLVHVHGSTHPTLLVCLRLELVRVVEASVTRLIRLT